MKFLLRLVFLINIAAVAALVASYLAAYVSPARFWPLAFFGLAYPVLALINLFFTGLWIMLLRKRFIFSALALLLGYAFAAGTWQPPFHRAIEELPESEMKVMSYNVRLFDLYNWKGGSATRDSLIQLIEREQPDILNLQEYYSNDEGFHIHTDSLKKWLGLPYVHTFYTHHRKGHEHWGLATFSRYPIINKGSILKIKGGNNACIYTDLRAGLDTIRVYNMHLQSIHLKKEDYDFVSHFEEEENEEAKIRGGRRILSRVKQAFIKRASQCDSIAANFDECKYPKIVCGDFNDPPVSYTYHRLSAGLMDAFRESGSGFGTTYHGLFPAYRIDYILHSEELRSADFLTIKEPWSDHYPVVCRVRRAEKK
jgi:endonuclease/exonuclease/phosphatase family metal-dependent hydrolase